MTGPPVVLLGGINLVRALGLGGIPAIVASTEPSTPAMASRYCLRRLVLPRLAHRTAVVARLLRVGDELEREFGARPPLFYGDDDWLGLVQEYSRELSTRYRLLLNPPELARALHDKALFQALGEDRGLPVPQRLEWATLASYAGPVLVKPALKTDWEASPVYQQLFSHAGKARIFDSGARAAADPLVQSLRDSLQFQEYVPGDDRSLWSFHGFADADGELLDWFVGRKIRTHPALTGDSTYLELARSDALVALGRDVVRRLGLKGIFKMDFKRHAVSGRFFLLEINARFNLWHYLGAKNGVNLPRTAYDYLVHGLRPPHVEAATRWRWLALRLDWRHYRREKPPLAGWLGSLLVAPKVYDLWAWDDPLPFFVDLHQYLPRLRRKIGRRIMRWLSTAS
jgi:predicted ATP-grasp superfamily ATP-dependent carboligase